MLEVSGQVSLRSIVNRAYLKWLWYRNTYRFNWSHKPLCGRFSDGVVRIWGVYLCRSCLLLYVWLLLGLATVLVRPDICGGTSAYVFTGAAIGTLVLSNRRWYKAYPRWVRDVLRSLTGWSVSVSAGMLFTGQYVLSIIVLGAMYVFWKVYLGQRRVGKLKACEGCSQLKASGICEGFRYQAQRIRQYEEQATEHVYRTGYVPAITPPGSR